MMGSPTLLLLACLATVFVSASAAADKIVCYYTNWAVYRSGEGKYNPEDVDPTLCTQVIYSFAVLDESSYLMKSHDSSLDLDKGFFKKIVGLKKQNPKLKVLLALGGWTDSQTATPKYSQMVSDPKRRANFIQHAAKLLQEHGFDGLDLDWEYPAPGDKANFATFVKELKEAFNPLNLLVTAAVSGAKWKIDEAYDVPSLGKYLDQIHIMAYDLKGAWDQKTGHHAPIYSSDGLSDDGAVSHFIQLGAPKEKLILGMPLYGRSWTLSNANNNGIGAATTGPGEKGKFTGEGGLLSYYEICSTKWAKTVTDPNGQMGPYSYQGNQWTSYDDPDILKKKTEYIKSKGLGGAMVWDLALDDFTGHFCNQGRYPLMNAINLGLGLGGNPNGGSTLKPGATTTEGPTTGGGGGGGGGGGECHSDGALLPNPKDCTSFFKCAGGVLYPVPCPPGLHFSVACHCCNWPALSECK